MLSQRRRLVGNILIFGISAPAVLAILVLALVAKPWAGGDPSVSYWLLPIMLVGITSSHLGRKAKATVKP